MKRVIYTAINGETYSAPIMNDPFFDLTDYSVTDNWGTGYDLLRVWLTAVDPPKEPLVLLEVNSRWEGEMRVSFSEALPYEIEKAGRLAGYRPDENPLAHRIPERAS